MFVLTAPWLGSSSSISSFFTLSICLAVRFLLYFCIGGWFLITGMFSRFILLVVRYLFCLLPTLVLYFLTC